MVVLQQNAARSYRKENEAPAFTNFGDLLYTSTLYDRNQIWHGNQTFGTKMGQFYRLDYAPSTWPFCESNADARSVSSS